ncbi:transcription termination factor Rho, partial [Streptomyces nanshensis]
MSDTTDLMGVNAAPPESDGSGGTSSGGAAAEKADAPATDAAAAPASGAAPKRRRTGTGLEGMVLAELQQVASGLGIKGTARMRKSQLIETIKERQAGGGSSAGTDAPAARGKDGDAVEGDDQSAKPRRRATSRARTGDSGGDGREDSAQIDIPGQPANEEKAEGDRRGRRERGE